MSQIDGILDGYNHYSKCSRDASARAAALASAEAGVEAGNENGLTLEGKAANSPGVVCRGRHCHPARGHRSDGRPGVAPVDPNLPVAAGWVPLSR